MPFPTRRPTPPEASGTPAAAPVPSGRKAAFNVMLSEEDSARLDAVASALQRSRGAVLREALRYLHQMTVQGIPTCASGAFCVVPNVHAHRGPLPAAPAPGRE